MKYFFFAIGFGILFVMGVFIPRHGALAVTSTIIDNSINTTITSHNGTTFTDVFTNTSTGYAFYRDSTGACDYAKTTNGGTVWAAAKIIDPQTDCLRIAIWYDRWTPGNTTGTYIHIATIDSGSGYIWYSKFNTVGDVTTTPIAVSAKEPGSFAAGRTLQSITEGTNGKIYTGVYNRNVNFVLQCAASNCATASSSWSLVGATSSWGTIADDWMLLLPLQNGNILNIRTSIGTGTILSKVWNDASSTWDANWATVDGNCPVNTTYDGGFGAAVNSISNDVYMDSACNNKTISANTGAIRTYEYSAASSTWTRETDVETSSTLGITGAKLGLDINTGDLYAVYTGRPVATSTPANVYYKISTSTTMSVWGARQGPINATSADIYGARIDGMSDTRLYATWADASNGTVMNGQTVAIFTPNTLAESDYMFFQNENSTQVGNQFDLENTSSVIPLAGNPFRLRMLVEAVGTGYDINAASFNLQYATSSNGACATDFSDGLSYVDVGTATSSPISFYTNSGAANGAALTANGQDPTDGTNAIVNESYVSQNSFSDNIGKLFGGEDGKWDFSLINNSGSTGQNYCFRIVNSNDSLLSGGYTAVASAQVDAAPVVTGVSLNAGQSIALIEGTTTPITVTGTVTDANGGSDLYSISGMLYRTSSSSSCTANNNDCYIGTGANCSINSCAGTSCSVSCLYRLYYFAQPTDSGTPWSGDSWTALIQASDTVLSGGIGTSSPQTLLSLLAFTTTSTINYGSLNQGSSTANLTASSVIISSGNDAMNVTVYGTNMTSGAFSIPVGQQHFATSSISYASGNTLLANPGSTVAIDLAKPNSTSSPTSTLYWGISIPSGQFATSYTGGNSFIGVEAPLPWP